MKVIIDGRTTQDEIKYNGVGRYSRFIIEFLLRNNPDTHFDLLMYDSPSTIDHVIAENLPNVRIVKLGKFDGRGGITMIKYNLDIFFHISLNKALKELDLKDAVFFSPYFWKGVPVFKIPTVAILHDFALPRFNSYSTISPFHNILRFIHYWYELFKVYFAKQIIVHAEYTKRDVAKYMPFLNKKKVSTVYLGVYQEKVKVEFEKYLPENWQQKGYLLYLGGGVTKNKNSIGVVNGFKSFIQGLEQEGIQRKDFPYLVIAGKNFIPEFGKKEAIKFNKYVKELEIDDLIHYTGFYDDNARWPIVKNSFAFIHLSLFEGFGFALAEAMRAGVPVIAHKGSTYPEVVGDGGILVDGEDAYEVGNAIEKVYKDKDFAFEIAKKGYEQSLKFDWDKTALETFKVLKKAFDGNSK